MAQRRPHISIAYDESPKNSTNTESSTSLTDTSLGHARSSTLDFGEVAILPSPEDNCALVNRRIEAGSRITDGDGPIKREWVLLNTILEGHRFCYKPIRKGEALLSWGLPFGYATRDILPGEYVCNTTVLESLQLRNLDFELPNSSNFEDRISTATLVNYESMEPVKRLAELRTFPGYKRPPSRRAGTRNFILLLGLTSTVGAFARALERHVKSLKDCSLSMFPNIDGVVAVAHTEGGTDLPMNNIDLLLRTLAGFCVHGNVGAVLVMDINRETNPRTLSIPTLRNYMHENDFPIEDVLHSFLTLTGHHANDLETATSFVKNWLPLVNKNNREDIPLAELAIGLQCGGSDAFSGVTGNPLAGRASYELIRHDGIACLAETDELIGAESYIVKGARTKEVAEQFLATVRRYANWSLRHGQSPEGNPSGGNKFRGLYNVNLKSVGAGMKKPKYVPLDYVIEYGERVQKGGYYFMDSPGNDLESVAGQVGAGCQVIYFTTGNGSITNFPFVPTIKIVTTSGRFNMLHKDMDVNAGRLLEGETIEDLGRELFELTVRVASGERTRGEEGRHAQVSIWRDWPLNEERAGEFETLKDRPLVYSGKGLKTKISGESQTVTFDAFIATDGAPTTDRVALLLPTSLCSSEVSRQIALDINEQIRKSPTEWAVTRIASLPHTEGCGMSGDSCEDIFRRTILNSAISPLVSYCVFLEHGCERTHNDYMAHYLQNMGIDKERFGWASIQMNGGIEMATEKVKSLFMKKLHVGRVDRSEIHSLKGISVSILTPPRMLPSEPLALFLAGFSRRIIDWGATLVVPSLSRLLERAVFVGEVVDAGSTDLATKTTLRPSVGYAQRPNAGGFHVMETFTDNFAEMVTGLGAVGVQLCFLFTEGTFSSAYYSSHPLALVHRIAVNGNHVDSDLQLDLANVSSDECMDLLVNYFLEACSGRRIPKRAEETDFQISRGPLGISV